MTRRLGISLGFGHRRPFSDGEVNVELLENVRGKDVCPAAHLSPTNDNLMELLVMVDAPARPPPAASPPPSPYFGYARQDRRPRSARVPITAKVVANMLQAVPASSAC